jgi:hypothetical protein
LTKIFFINFLVWWSKKRKQRDHIYARYIFFCLNMYEYWRERKFENPKIFNIHTEPLFFVLPHWRTLFFVILLFAERNICIVCKEGPALKYKSTKVLYRRNPRIKISSPNHVVFFLVILSMFVYAFKPDELVIVELLFILHLMIWTKLRKTLRGSVPK